MMDIGYCSLYTIIYILILYCTLDILCLLHMGRPCHCTSATEVMYKYLSKKYTYWIFKTFCTIPFFFCLSTKCHVFRNVISFVCNKKIHISHKKCVEIWLSISVARRLIWGLTLNLLTTTIVASPSNASKWQMGFNSAFKGLNDTRMQWSSMQESSVGWLLLLYLAFLCCLKVLNKNTKNEIFFFLFSMVMK